MPPHRVCLSLGELKHPLARKSARLMIDSFGPPPDCTRESMIWRNIRSRGIDWTKVELKNEAIRHSFPAPHVDFLYSTAKMDMPPDAQKEVAGLERFGSAQYDPLKKEVTVRCAFMTKNELTYKKLVESIETHNRLESRLKTLDKAQAKAPEVNK